MEQEQKIVVENNNQYNERLSRLRERYPLLRFPRYDLVENVRSQRFIIDDLGQASPTKNQAIALLRESCTGEITIYPTETLSQIVKNALQLLDVGEGEGLIGRRTTLVIFPGDGADSVRRAIQPYPLVVKATTVPTSRLLKPDGSIDTVNIGDLTNKPKDIQTILVIDDVIASGSTLDAIREKLLEAFPNVNFMAMSLAMLSPLQNRNKKNKLSQSGIAGYDVVWTAVVYDGLNGIPAINSLSTLIGNTPKSYAVRERYQKYVLDPKGFNEAIRQLREMQNTENTVRRLLR